MRIVFAGNKSRGAECLRAVVEADHEVLLALVHPQAASASAIVAAAEAHGIPIDAPPDVNAPETVERLRSLGADLIVLAGYGQLVRSELLAAAPHGAVNLHGGKLPQYRGSSPMNWALINGETEVGISVIQVDEGVDTGDVLARRVIAVGPDDTIADVESRANGLFPSMLVEVIDGFATGTLNPQPQDAAAAAYYPVRFPDDGLILWDTLDAISAHNRIRALTTPFPGAFTVHDGRRLKLLRSRLEQRVFRGEPGRVYRAGPDGFLVAAVDRCLWVTEASYADDGSDALAAMPRYAMLGTVKGAALLALEDRA